jgi:hypothetical protein
MLAWGQVGKAKRHERLGGSEAWFIRRYESIEYGVLSIGRVRKTW